MQIMAGGAGGNGMNGWADGWADRQRCPHRFSAAQEIVPPGVPLPPTPHLWDSVPSGMAGPEAVKAEQAGLLLGPGRPSQPASCRQPLTSSCR